MKVKVEDVINLLLYNPYKEDFAVMVDEDERLHIKGNTWLVTLNHKTGDFSFKGELNRYYFLYQGLFWSVIFFL